MAKSGLLITLVLLGGAAHAQMDPSTALLLRGSPTAPTLGALEDEVHVAPARVRRPPRPRIEITPAPPADDEAPAEVTPPPAAFVPPAAWSRQPAGVDTPATVREERLSVRLAAGYFALDSQSASSPRDYRGGGAGLDLGITLWATSAWGLRADYLTTVGAGVRDGRAGFGLDHQEILGGVTYRSSQVDPRWQFGLGLYESENQVARAAGGPVGGRSLGPDVSVTYVRPASESYAHVFEAHARPYLDHRELDSADRASSGPAGAALGASLGVGGHLELERQRRLFWRLRYTFEHDAFPRAAGVDVGQAWLLLGLKWGA